MGLPIADGLAIAMTTTTVVRPNLTEFLCERIQERSQAPHDGLRRQILQMLCEAGIAGAQLPGDAQARWCHAMLDLQLSGNCSVLGTDVRLSSPAAAYVNGSLMRAPASSSCGVVVLAAAVATAEYLDLGMGALLDSIGTGLDVGSFLMSLLGPEHQTSGWDPAGTAYRLAAVAAVASLAALPVERTRVALGIVATEAGGLIAAAGSEGFGLTAGKSAFDAVEAGLIAMDERIVGVADPVGGRRGFLATLRGLERSQFADVWQEAAARRQPVGVAPTPGQMNSLERLTTLGDQILSSHGSAREFAAGWAGAAPPAGV